MHGGRLLSVARRFLGNNEDAEDAVQEAFIRAFKSIHTFEERAQLHTWLHRIVVNTALMKLRERRRKPQESIEDLLPRSPPTDIRSRSHGTGATHCRAQGDRVGLYVRRSRRCPTSTGWY